MLQREAGEAGKPSQLFMYVVVDLVRPIVPLVIEFDRRTRVIELLSWHMVRSEQAKHCS